MQNNGAIVYLFSSSGAGMNGKTGSAGEYSVSLLNLEQTFLRMTLGYM